MFPPGPYSVLSRSHHQCLHEVSLWMTVHVLQEPAIEKSSDDYDN